MVDGGDARLEVLERGVEGVEVEIDVPGGVAAGEPQFERVVGRAELERRQADVVMGIDHAGHDHLPIGAEDLGRLVRRGKLGERSDLDDGAVLLVDGGIVEHQRAVAACDLADDVLSRAPASVFPLGISQIRRWTSRRCRARGSGRQDRRRSCPIKQAEVF